MALIVFCHVADSMYPVQLGLTLEDSKRLWLQLLVADEASMSHPLVRGQKLWFR